MAPDEIFCACSNNLRAPSALASRKYHQAEAMRAVTLGWSPASGKERCMREVGCICSRYCAMPASISTTASSASRPFQGAVPAWADSPWKVNFAEMSADWMMP
jgi:hypothetical protein